MQASSMISLPSRSFNRYSNSEVAAIAARVVEEFGSEECFDEFYFERDEESAAGRSVDGEGVGAGERGRGDFGESDAEEGEESEFTFATRGSGLPSPISADEAFHNGQIRPVYPVFNRGLFLEHARFSDVDEKVNGERNSDAGQVPAVRLPLRKLFTEERETTMMRTSSSSSSEADELEGVPADSYCVWRPKEEAATEGRCKKSSSSGGSSSKRWKLKSLLHRSHSDGGKDNFVFLSPSNSGRKKAQGEERARVAPSAAERAKPVASPPPLPLYSRDAGEKRRSYLPYRQDLMGIFSNVNGLSKNLQPF